ncbi:hypothetical protein SEMRO_653_G181910.1 [Seminavis robusta]|uniref:Uncharacterized protein n=1 Tax=Seminavis robusta TaxID=568900 RepID=A0A9N8HJC9_9STRA|nr:hypothetical protein SEMRO_653_G181910.1 [Seminavis robusta]|eukprot:Sro653_g181910.1 n/a (245) ;mRNA; r:2348-3272
MNSRSNRATLPTITESHLEATAMQVNGPSGPFRPDIHNKSRKDNKPTSPPAAHSSPITTTPANTTKKKKKKKKKQQSKEQQLAPQQPVTSPPTIPSTQQSKQDQSIIARAYHRYHAHRANLNVCLARRQHLEALAKEYHRRDHLEEQHRAQSIIARNYKKYKAGKQVMQFMVDQQNLLEQQQQQQQQQPLQRPKFPPWHELLNPHTGRIYYSRASNDLMYGWSEIYDPYTRQIVYDHVQGMTTL